ncbi:unnamed protein product [Rotaria sp. Silwood2]|nr:unnamed protein product [Rotaria sp. Silwood2]CAF2628841.1 unnamed protein product [Rotaria sp. Silwood2]CAF2878958.1 unnamed protein product [Rotaria sp. Silwood2]CAF3041231.1 unnamed protein product [Rotaria sp. Silwood2]CAF3926180.1 unnamed protein product [Rotaria sp. Silwood2]
MNSKYLAVLLMLFGLLFTLTQCERLTLNDRHTDDSDSAEGGDDSSDDVDDALREEKRAIQDFLQNEDDASQFLDQSRRLFSDQKSHMKEAKKKYEEKCERLLHPRYCPDLATWPAWNQAWNAATGKK